MSDQVISIIALVLVFAIATFSAVHLGALALVAAFIIGSTVADESTDDLFSGFPGDLFVVLVGVTLLFAIAKNNGTVDWLVNAAVKAVRGRIALIPWVMFLVTAMLTAVGAVTPAAVGIVAPIGLGFAVAYGINPVLMGLLIANGASAGGFSPIGVFGSITNNVVERNDLPGNPALLFAASFLFNVVLCVIVFFVFGGRRLLGQRAGTYKGGGDTNADSERHDDAPPPGGTGGTGGQLVGAGAVPRRALAVATTTRPPAQDEPLKLDGPRALTLLGLLSLVAGALFFDLDVGLMALTITVVLSLVSPKSVTGAVDRCAWSTVLLVCGIVTYVSQMERMGTIDYLGKQVASIEAPLLGALLICLIGALVSAFASTTGMLGALIPLAVPFLLAGEVGAVGLITALAISASVVDASPFSTSGALVTANTPEDQRDFVFRRLMAWGLGIAVIGPLVTWALFVVPTSL
ncbi:SLC13 family permease [Streptomyces durmitorensis]|uniref:SLC13 family permease n=1 Tax=Streptomyces durmitorensis TaxID=319947 RepID=A0ABY4Q788_9ACTN|nr:SLC13 family permease [Streptomyces durmitorensis]UQT61011.1 SLC13 family permease [Streptomyces durmitorensis]